MHWHDPVWIKGGTLVNMKAGRVFLAWCATVARGLRGVIGSPKFIV